MSADPRQAEDRKRRRIIRLLQVREQSKDIARNLRCKASQEKQRQTELVKNAKQRQLDIVKQKRIDELRSDHNKSSHNTGVSFDAAESENVKIEEWKAQQKYNSLKAHQRGNRALSVLHKTNAEKKNSRISLNKKDSVTTKCNDNKENEINNVNLTENFMNHDQNVNKASMKDDVSKSDDIIVVIEQADGSEPNDNANISLQRERVDNIEINRRTLETNSEQEPLNMSKRIIINHERPDDHIETNIRNVTSAEVVQESVVSTSCCNDRPINIISDFIKRRNSALDLRENENVQIENRIDVTGLNAIRDVIQQSKCLVSEYKDSFRDYSKCSQNEITKPKKKSDLPTAYSWTSKQPFYKTSKVSKCKTHKLLHREGSSDSNKPKRNRYKRLHFNPAVKWQIGSNKLNFNEKFIKSYDYLNKFHKNIAVDNSCFVQKLPKVPKNAYQLAREETQTVNQLKSTENIEKIEKKRKIRGKKAMQRLIAEKDYNNLIEELKVLQQLEKQKDVMSSELLQQSGVENSVPGNSCHEKPRETILKNKNTKNFKISEENSSNGEAPQVNVRNSNSESSKNSNGYTKNSDIENIIRIVENQKLTLKNELKKIKITKVNKEVKSCQTNISEIEENFSSNNENSDVVSKIKKKVSGKSSKESENGKVLKNSLSFEGLQILIELKKDKNIIANVLKKKHTISNSSSSEISISNHHNINASKQNFSSFHKSDSSTSTAYMSLPEKLTTKVEDYLKRNDLEAIHGIVTRSNSKQVIEKRRDFACQSEEVVSKEEKCIGTDNCDKPAIKYSFDAIKDREKRIQLRLKKYVDKLLAMSNDEVNRIEVDVSDVPTPSSSVINISSNTHINKNIEMTDGMDKLKEFIKENYKLLNELHNKDNQPSCSEYETRKKIISDEIIQEKLLSMEKQNLEDEQRVLLISEQPSCSKYEMGKKVIQDRSKMCEENPAVFTADALVNFFNSSEKELIDFDNNSDMIINEQPILPEIIIKRNMKDNDISLISIPSANKDTLENEAETEFVPLLSNIPKPALLKKENQIREQAKPPPPVLNKHFSDESIRPMTPHELSTIIEVDTPATVKSTTSRHKNSKLSEELDKKQQKTGKNDNIIIPCLEDSSLNDYQLKLFSNLSDIASILSKTKNDSQELKLSSFCDKSVESLFRDMSFPKISGFSEIRDSDSASEKIGDELEVMFKDAGMSWAIGALKRMKKSSGSSVDTVSSATDSIKSGGTLKSSVGLSTVKDDLDISNNVFENFSLENVANYNELEKLFERADRLGQEVKKIIGKSGKNRKDVEDRTEGSKDKTQHRTSTPVISSKSQHSTDSSNNSKQNSNVLFGIESDLSSVKNLSN